MKVVYEEHPIFKIADFLRQKKFNIENVKTSESWFWLYSKNKFKLLGKVGVILHTEADKYSVYIEAYGRPTFERLKEYIKELDVENLSLKLCAEEPLNTTI